MIDLSTLLVFLLAVFVLFLSPGPNMAFVVAHGISHGTRGGFAAALGIAVADLVLTVLTATGVTALIAAWPPSFDVLRYAGALYLLWMAAQALRSGGGVAGVGDRRLPLRRIFRLAMFNSLLNPKALLFFMLFLPQFVAPERGHTGWQLALLGVILSLVLLLLNTLLGGLGGKAGTWLARRPLAVRVQGWVQVGMLLALAARLLLLDRPAAR